MRKVLVLVGIFIVTVAVGRYLLSRTGPEVEEVKGEKALGVTARPSPKKDLRRASASSVGEMRGSNRDLAPTKGVSGKEPTAPEETVSLVKPEERSTRVNDTPVSVYDVIPPGTLKPGDELPEGAHRKFMDLAEDERLLVQEAQERGLADTPEYQAMVEDMREDLTEMSALSDEQRQWRLEHFSTMALINELYRQEGLMPQRVSGEEADRYYETRSDDYEWVRERETLKGTSPDKIERRVRQEMRRDRAVRLNKGLRERRRAYLESLRERADIEKSQ